jgi:hypothetical protein
VLWSRRKELQQSDVDPPTRYLRPNGVSLQL